MQTLDWQQIYTSEHPKPLDTILAAMIPVHAPHTHTGLSNEILEILENLQARLLAPGTCDVVPIDIAAKHTAVIWNNKKIIARYQHDQGDFGSWLERSAPWDSTSKLFLVDMGRHELRYLYCENHIELRFTLQIHIEDSQLQDFFSEWARRHCFFSSNDAVGYLNNCLEEGGVSALFRAASPRQILQNTQQQRKILLQIQKKLENALKDSGVVVKIVDLQWAAADSLQTSMAPKREPRHNEEKPERGSLTEKIERRRFMKSLQDLKHSHDSASATTMDTKTPISSADRKKQNREDAAERRDRRRSEMDMDIPLRSKTGIASGIVDEALRSSHSEDDAPLPQSRQRRLESPEEQITAPRKKMQPESGPAQKSEIDEPPLPRKKFRPDL